MTCHRQPHNDSKHWIKKPDRRREGFYRVTCEACGRFLGYWHPNFDTKQKEQKKIGRDLGVGI